MGPRGKRRLQLATALVALALAMPAGAAAAPQAVKGFEIETFAEGIPNPTNLAFDDKGILWATSASAEPGAAGYVWRVPRGGDEPQEVIGPLNSALGLTWHEGK